MGRFRKPKGKSRLKPLLTFERQRCEGDCCIAALSSFLNIEYEKVLIAAGKITNDPHQVGVFFTDLVKVAKELKVNLRVKKKEQVDLQNDKGILDVKIDAGRIDAHHHAVVLMNGLIFDVGDGEVWEPPRYEIKYRAECRSLLCRE